MPPELEAKLIAPDEMRLPDLNGLVDAATAVRLPERYLEAVYCEGDRSAGSQPDHDWQLESAGGAMKGSAMWNSFSTDARAGITAEVISYPGDGGDEIHAWLARPDGDGPAPGIVAVHHMPGWDEFYREFCERLARHGHIVICPDLYCRFGHGSPDDVAAMVRSRGGVRDGSVVADCAAALSWLKALPASNGRAGVIGTCSGGRHALLAASLVPGFDAVADLWGGGVVMAEEELSEARPAAPIDYTAQLTAPLLGLFGNDDTHPSPEQVNQHEAELKRHGKMYEFYRYDGAGHGFFYYHTPMYRPAAAMHGWEKVFSFFGRHLQS